MADDELLHQTIREFLFIVYLLLLVSCLKKNKSIFINQYLLPILIIF